MLVCNPGEVSVFLTSLCHLEGISSLIAQCDFLPNPALHLKC